MLLSVINICGWSIRTQKRKVLFSVMSWASTLKTIFPIPSLKYLIQKNMFMNKRYNCRFQHGAQHLKQSTYINSGEQKPNYILMFTATVFLARGGFQILAWSTTFETEHIFIAESKNQYIYIHHLYLSKAKLH